MTTGRINQIPRSCGARAGPASQGGRPPPRAPVAPGGAAGDTRFLPEGAQLSNARPPRHPRRTGGTRTAIQLPPLKAPQAPVRTQGSPQGAGEGVGRAAAYGPRVGGPDPADTPANGGSRGAAPPWRLGDRGGTAANDPQTPPEPGAAGPPGFGHHSGGVPEDSLTAVCGHPLPGSEAQLRGLVRHMGSARQPAWHGRSEGGRRPVARSAPLPHIPSGLGWAHPWPANARVSGSC